MQCAGLLVFRQLVNFQRAEKGQDKVCVNVQIRDNRQSSPYDMSKAEYRGIGGKRGGEKYC